MLVAVAHARVSFFGYNPGVVAVISFFLLSGYVMTMLIEKHYKQASVLSHFYLDRAARLFPQFIFYMLLASACIYFLKLDFPAIRQLTFGKWVLNFFMLPQGFYMFWATGALVIPQSWSLGLEITFYMVIPWILIYCSKRQTYGIAAASFLIFLAAYLGKIPSDYCGYRLLPGTLFMFLVGWSFFQNDNESRKFRRIAFVVAGIMLLIAHFNKSIYGLPYNKEVLLGLMVGIPAIGFLKRYRFSGIDEFLGNLSYGLFLNHIIIIWIMRKFFAVDKFDVANVIILLLISSALSFCSFFFVERPALRWRHTIRYGNKKSADRIEMAGEERPDPLRI